MEKVKRVEFNLTVRFTDVDWICRCQVIADLLLRPDGRELQSNQSSDSIRGGKTKRRRRHEFDIGSLHSAPDGQLLFFGVGNCLHSGLVVNAPLLPHRSLCERQSDRTGSRFLRRDSGRGRPARNIFHVVDAQFTGGRSNLAGDFRHVTRGLHERQRLHAFQRLAPTGESFRLNN